MKDIDEEIIERIPDAIETHDKLVAYRGRLGEMDWCMTDFDVALAKIKMSDLMSIGEKGKVARYMMIEAVKFLVELDTEGGE